MATFNLNTNKLEEHGYKDYTINILVVLKAMYNYSQGHYEALDNLTPNQKDLLYDFLYNYYPFTGSFEEPDLLAVIGGVRRDLYDNLSKEEDLFINDFIYEEFDKPELQ